MSKVLVCDGDSITVGDGIATPYSSSLSLIGSWIIHNVAVDGEDLSTMLANAPTVVDPLFTGPGDTVTIWGGINDLDQGVAPANLIPILWAYCDARHAVGWTVIVMTMISRGGPDDLLRLEYNQLIYAGVRAHADGVADMGANAFMGRFGAFANPTYFQADEIHPTQLAATTILAPITSAQVNSPSFPVPVPAPSNKFGASRISTGTDFASRIVSPRTTIVGTNLGTRSSK